MIEKIGALWKSTSTNPKAPFASGEIEVNGQKVRIVLWNNNKRPDKKDPDFKIAKDTPRETADTNRDRERRDFRDKHTDTPPLPPAKDDFVDEIPF